MYGSEWSHVGNSHSSCPHRTHHLLSPFILPLTFYQPTGHIRRKHWDPKVRAAGGFPLWELPFPAWCPLVRSSNYTFPPKVWLNVTFPFAWAMCTCPWLGLSPSLECPSQNKWEEVQEGDQKGIWGQGQMSRVFIVLKKIEVNPRNKASIVSANITRGQGCWQPLSMACVLAGLFMLLKDKERLSKHFKSLCK